jgi:leucine dehydrogenase
MDTHDNLYTFTDRKAGLKAIVAMHRPRSGVAMGATRLYPYASEGEAIEDALRLSRAMTYKAACAGLPVGGGKAVIIADPAQKTEALLRSYGRFIQGLGGQFITGQDMNLSQADVAVMAEMTEHVTGVLDTGLNPAITTAQGVIAGMRAAVQARFGTRSLASVSVAVQGVGAVGGLVVELLRAEGAKVAVADLDAERAAAIADRYDARVAPPNQILTLDVDVVAPCGRGGILTPQSIPMIKAAIVAGAANNQLADPERDGLLALRRGIVYCPDFVINAGGLIEVYYQHFGYDRAIVEAKLAAIESTIGEVLAASREQAISAHDAAVQLGQQRLVEPAPAIPPRRAASIAAERAV